MSTLDQAYWDKRYNEHDTGWDIGGVSTPIKTYIDQLAQKNMRILVPGAGNAYEAIYLVNNGFTDVTVIDISPAVITTLRQSNDLPPTKALTIICGDFFDHSGRYDLVIEQTFFCALQPALRTDYVKHMHTLLNPGGRLAGLLFNREFDGGPPFGGDEATYRTLFEPLFIICKMETAYNSIKPRQGTELWINLQKK